MIREAQVGGKSVENKHLKGALAGHLSGIASEKLLLKQNFILSAIDETLALLGKLSY